MSKHHHRIPARAWARLRKRIFHRDGWRCQVCGKAGRLECDHVIPLHQGGADIDPDNLQALCRSCHIAKTRQENEARHPVPAQVEAWRAFVATLTES